MLVGVHVHHWCVTWCNVLCDVWLWLRYCIARVQGVIPASATGSQQPAGKQKKRTSFAADEGDNAILELIFTARALWCGEDTCTVAGV